MEWFRQLQFVSAVPMPLDMADEYGTTVNGMWADPERISKDAVADDHRTNHRVLFSVPLIALTPRTYEQPDAAHLLDEVCRDIDSEASECDWYYWEDKPVFAACIYSDAFREYLFERCTRGVDAGADVVNLDEIMTSVGLMNRGPRGSGFCGRCLERFRSHLRTSDDEADLTRLSDEALRTELREHGPLYERYRRFHQEEAFHVMLGFIHDLRAYADARNPGFAISANVAYLGNHVEDFGALWGCLWGPHLDFVLMENEYRVRKREPHVLLPRGTFAAWYRLGASFKGAPTWICPSINVPRQLEGSDHRRYYELMFLEAYANRGRWGYFWGPGADIEARRYASAPDVLKDHIRFIERHRDLYEIPSPMNEVAILYLEGPILRRPVAHEKYLALAQALAETGFQFDVLFGGDGTFNPETLDPAALRGYRVILVPEARDLGAGSVRALEGYVRSGGELVLFSESPLDPQLVRAEDGQALYNFWRRYGDEDRERIAASSSLPASSRIECSEPGVGVVRYADGARQVLHLLDYRYDASSDAVTPVRDLRLRIPWDRGDASCMLLALGGEQRLATKLEDGMLVVEVPELDPYALLVVEPETGR